MEILKRRILREYNDLINSKEKEKDDNIKVWLVENNIKHWKAKIKGPVKFNENFYIFFFLPQIKKIIK